jgi:3'(2'), 5'-bisphosphate nucleotidase
VPTLSAAACADLMEALTALGVSAAATVLLAAGERGARIKADGSPVTAADEAAEAVILDGLRRIAPALPVISEEQTDPHQSVAAGESVILVDPLDGTRDFIAGRDEYTINIALVTDGTPILGVIAAPALGLLWRGIAGRGAERLEYTGDGKLSRPSAIHVRPRPQSEVVVMVSRSHLDAATRSYVDGLPHAQLLQSGSALKFCRVAEGAADRYPRLAPTRDWDVAAGHAILKAAGGSVTAPDGGPIVYGTKALTIPAFIAWSEIKG